MSEFADIALVPQPRPAVWRDAAHEAETCEPAPTYAAWLDAQPAKLMQCLNNAYISTYATKAVLTGNTEVARGFEEDVPVRQLFQAARRKGINCLGVAPAHKRKGEFAYPTPGDAPRVYQDRAKRPHYSAGTLSVSAFESEAGV